uniref:Uncharacterized protein n=1 Tax=Parascaris equorum TaxID=6256 RepID=A0A914R100_PAREQ
MTKWLRKFGNTERQLAIFDPDSLVGMQARLNVNVLVTDRIRGWSTPTKWEEYLPVGKYSPVSILKSIGTNVLSTAECGGNHGSIRNMWKSLGMEITTFCEIKRTYSKKRMVSSGARNVQEVPQLNFPDGLLDRFDIHRVFK